MSGSQALDPEKRPSESVDVFDADLEDEKLKELGELRLPTSDPSSRPPSVRTREDVAAAQVPGNEHDDGEPKLPMSKARCIALVATVTGAAFLNVSGPHGARSQFRSKKEASDILTKSRPDSVHSICCNHPPEHR